VTSMFTFPAHLCRRARPGRTEDGGRGRTGGPPGRKAGRPRWPRRLSSTDSLSWLRARSPARQNAFRTAGRRHTWGPAERARRATATEPQPTSRCRRSRWPASIRRADGGIAVAVVEDFFQILPFPKKTLTFFFLLKWSYLHKAREGQRDFSFWPATKCMRSGLRAGRNR